ncbi:MAG: RadC family protein [Deltaproteobacteria bacterium]|nr:RadC family protein [Deltaproteobacteria bacterium]
MVSKNPNPNSGHRKRLKERFLKSSLDGFHDYEIVELLLTYAIPRRDVKPLAKGLVGRFKGLKGLFEAPDGELAGFDGVGENTAILIGVIKEVACAYLREQAERNRPIRSPEDVMAFLGSAMNEETSERFFAIYLNSKNEILGFETLFEGPLKHDSLSPRTVIETAFKYNARSMIFVHSLPDGKISPTDTERNLTEELEHAAAAVDILVHDHIIAGKDSHLSAREIGWLKGA